MTVSVADATGRERTWLVGFRPTGDSGESLMLYKALHVAQHGGFWDCVALLENGVSATSASSDGSSRPQLRPNSVDEELGHKARRMTLRFPPWLFAPVVAPPTAAENGLARRPSTTCSSGAYGPSRE